MSQVDWPLATVWTIGHSTRVGPDFIHILKEHQIQTLIDVRSFPGSRRYPQFNSPDLSASLASESISYYHLPYLGGRRQALPDSKNIAWRDESFRGFADHMESVEFKQAIEELSELARKSRTAIMCAEAVWWRCHRSLIADYLKALGVTIIHLSNAKQSQIHPYTSAARIVRGRLSYKGLFPEEPGELRS
ncbi:MAG: DUF488 domain-containing protein [Pyrinomonadaceae bacterium]|nr:DUF488 domain-containing protein [Pyrinomonadaceae bacterium]